MVSGMTASIHDGELTRTRLRTPKAAAIAGIVSSILLIATFWLIRTSVPAEALPANIWLRDRAKTIVLALNLIPFAGIAFLWFIGVLRDRLGQREDRLFATVFFGSGLLFLGMLFSAAAVVAAAILAFADRPNQPIDSDVFTFVRSLAFNLVNTYAIKMAGVFMISTSTVALHTEFAPRSIALLGYLLAVFLLFLGHHFEWSFFVFPLWVMLLSIHILVDNYRRPSGSGEKQGQN
jgi:hypothetical protein